MEQRELAGLRCLGAQATDVAAFLVLRVREDGVTHLVTDGTPTLASYAGMADSTMRLALAFLARGGVVYEGKLQPRSGIGQGSWIRPRRARPYEDWAQDTLTLIGSCVEPSHRHSPTGGGSSYTKTRRPDEQDPPISGARPADSSVHTPASSSVSPGNRFAKDGTNGIVELIVRAYGTAAAEQILANYRRLDERQQERARAQYSRDAARLAAGQ